MSKHRCLQQAVNSSEKKAWIEELRFFAPPIILFTLILHSRFVAQFGLKPPMTLSAVTLFFYIASTLTDIYTTHLCMGLKGQFEQNGHQFPVRETNWFLPDQPTLKQHLFSWPSLFSFLGIFYVFYVPAVGIGASLLHFCASWANLKTRRWLMQRL